MISAIENRRSIRKYRKDAIDRTTIEKIIYSATLAPSAKNRQPWKFIVYQGSKKDDQLTGIVAIGYPEENPDKRPRKQFEDIIEFRGDC